MSIKNRLANVGNFFQGSTKKVLCVCSAGLLRSPTAAVVLSQEPFNFNTRAVGCVKEFALIPFDAVMAHWADEIICMERHHVEAVLDELDINSPTRHKVYCLNIPDEFAYRQPQLMRLIAERYQETVPKVFG